MLPLSARNTADGGGPCNDYSFPILAAEKGLTLLEVLVSIALFAVLAGTLLSLFLFSANVFQKGAVMLDLQQNVRIAADFIIRDLRYAGTLLAVSKNEIKYRLPGEAATYTIKQKNSEIVYLIGRTENKIAYDISSLAMDWDEAKKIITLEIVGGEGGHSYAVRSAVRLQNLY